MLRSLKLPVLQFRLAALLDRFVTAHQNYVNDSAAGGSYERKYD